MPVGENQHFGGPGDHVDADLAENAPLGGRHEGVARARRSWRPAAPMACRRREPRRRGRRRSGRSRRRRQGARRPAPADWSRPAASAPPWRRAERPRPSPARRSSGPTTDSSRVRPAHKARPNSIAVQRQPSVTPSASVVMWSCGPLRPVIDFDPLLREREAPKALPASIWPRARRFPRRRCASVAGVSARSSKRSV